jgi:hypothetical protein
VLGVLVVVGFFVFSSKSNNQPVPPTSQDQQGKAKNVSIKASFAIFTNGTFRVFTASMYHNQSNDVFIESSNPNIVRVEKMGLTWNDFFKTLPMKLTRDCLTTGTGQAFCTNSNQVLRFYLNGERDQNALDRIINAADQLLVSYGTENEGQIQNQLQQVPIVK